MHSIRTQIDTYLQNMLKVQFQISDMIDHKLTKGQLREAFIHRLVLDEFPHLILKHGILCDGTWQSTQGDFLWLTDTARIGHLDVYDLNTCKMFMEIKSCATAAELRAIEKTSELIKEKHRGEEPIHIGMFCYSTTALEQTVLKKMGFSFDRELKSYNIYQSELDQMRHVDFLYSLNISEDPSLSPYFVVRDYMGNCTLYRDNPVIQYFLNFFRNI